MYWNEIAIALAISCIERLTLTWDVLKSLVIVVIAFQLDKININMRCIEIEKVIKKVDKKGWININMRCIEICEFNAPYNHRAGLTLTWDVLKLIFIIFFC